MDASGTIMFIVLLGATALIMFMAHRASQVPDNDKIDNLSAKTEARERAAAQRESAR